MILIDPRDGADPTHATSRELVRYITQLGVTAKTEHLLYGDLAFEGHGPDGSTPMIGFERKTLHDMLSCIDDARLVAHQKLGMSKMYKLSYLVLEGLWKCDDKGFLMEGFRNGSAWTWCKFRGKPVLYSKLYRYLISLQLAGMPVITSYSLATTAKHVVEYYQYFQKNWKDHKSMMEMQKISLPSLGGRPNLVRRWAADLDGVGPDLSARAGDVFSSGLELAIATPEDWAEIKGISLSGAKEIVKQIERRVR